MDKEPNVLLFIAVVLDPRYKRKFLRFCCSKICSAIEVIDIMGRIEECDLYRIFHEYDFVSSYWFRRTKPKRVLGSFRI